MQLNNIGGSLLDAVVPVNYGKVESMVGEKISVTGLSCGLGDIGVLKNGDRIECVGYKKEKAFFMSREPNTDGIKLGGLVRIVGKNTIQNVPSDLLGRVIDCDGNDLSGLEINSTIQLNLSGQDINPLERPEIKLPMDVGVRSINGFLSIGRGQRVGIMAGSGVGKSVLLGMMTRFTSADVVVVGLVGERGREVQDFITENLSSDAKKKSVLVVAPADSAPLKKIRCAEVATAVAEYYSRQGKNVLLMMDSITRYANAYRDVALSGGEMPVSRGYPPSVFNKIYSLIERAGTHKSGGSITGLYTVLVDGDNLNDPIADSCRGILDGHFVLSREMANNGYYPAIDISKSISRVMNSVTIAEHQEVARKIKSIYNTYNENKDLISMAYEPGTDSDIDLAIKMKPLIQAYLFQDKYERSDLKESLKRLKELMLDVNK